MKKINEDILVAFVAVERVAPDFDTLFSYKIPQELAKKAEPGRRVLVPFGRTNINRQGMIMKIGPPEESMRLKKIISVLDEKPLLNKEMLLLASWLKEHTFCTYYDAVRMIVPTGMMLNKEEKYFLNKEKESKILLNHEAFLEIQASQNGMLKNEILKLISNDELKKYVKDGYIEKKDVFKRKIQDQTQIVINRTDTSVNDEHKLTKKQSEVLQIIEEHGQISLKQALYLSGVTRAVADALEKKNLIYYSEEESFRTPYKYEKKSQNDIVLNAEQQKAYLGLKKKYDEEKANISLLFGVTGSGKTQVFLKLIEDTLESGKEVIMLVPEIALTSQIVRIFGERFGDKVAVLHSGLSLGERLDEHKRMASGQAKIAVGTRSAIFAPFENIGLIVMDEEQEYTYKSESMVRYHARDIAKFRCAYNDAKLVLSSATPSVESFYNAKEGNYALFTLENRFGEAGEPDVYIVDLNDSKIKGENNIVSPALEEAVNSALSRDEQVILLLNRRGFHTVTKCISCGEVLECKHCSVAVAYHKANGKFMCHLCGAFEEEKLVCRHCNGIEFEEFGLGTQKAEEEIENKFKSAKVLRMDMDTTVEKFSHEKKLSGFSAGKFDIMIGTQMVAKGLDFPNVTVVGVLLADQTLYADDFRSYEKAFSLLTQVVGRSGRQKKQGSAYIQTYTPYNEIISLAARGDYEKFFDSEITVRKAMLYPPFASFGIVGFSGVNHDRVEKSAMIFFKMLKKNIKNSSEMMPIRLMEPVPGGIYKAAGKYRYKIVFKCKNNGVTREVLRKTMSEHKKEGKISGVSLFIDLNFHGSL